jgi:uncharacterized protein
LKEDIEPLNLSHQSLLENKFHQLNLELSEYSFANLYLFRDLHRYQVMKRDEEIFIKGITRDGMAFIMPTSDPSKLPSTLLQSVLSEAEFLFPIPERWLFSLEKRLSQASFKEEESDYLFSITKLAYFPGRHLSKKRNLVKQLLNTHQVKSENFSDQLDDAQGILEDWQKEHGENLLETDYQACKEAIHDFSKLHLHGRMVYVDLHSAGFTIGEWISDRCYVVHFSKAKRAIKGLYQYLYQDLAQSIEGTCLWINLEQDLGISALRDSKHSYLPDKLLRKWRVQLQS